MHDSFTIRGNGEGYRKLPILFALCSSPRLDGAKQQRDSYKTFTQSKKLKCIGVLDMRWNQKIGV